MAVPALATATGLLAGWRSFRPAELESLSLSLLLEAAALLSVAYLIGCCCGYALRRVMHAATARPTPADLTQIRGIAPGAGTSLAKMGIHRIEQIAAWTKVDIDRIETSLAIKGRIRRERWVEQARELARAAA